MVQGGLIRELLIDMRKVLTSVMEKWRKEDFLVRLGFPTRSCATVPLRQQAMIHPIIDKDQKKTVKTMSSLMHP